MKPLTLADFKRITMIDTFGHYYSYRTKDHKEICLESCFSGYCVGLYNKRSELIGEKVCTNLNVNSFLPESEKGQALYKAIEIANQKLKEIQ